MTAESAGSSSRRGVAQRGGGSQCSSCWVLRGIRARSSPRRCSATRDIGTAAARLLAEGGSGKRVVELAGPREYMPRDVAAAVGRIVGKPVDVQQAPEEAMAPALLGAGMNAEWARLFQELTHGLNADIVVWEGGHPFWRGETEIESVLSTLLGKTTEAAARRGSS